MKPSPVRAPELCRIVQTPGILSGAPRLDGTRIYPESAWSFWQAGCTLEQIQEQYPTLTREDVLVSIAWCEGKQYAERRRRKRRA